MSAEPAPRELPYAELAELEERVEHALESGDESGLAVLGYGEISLVLAWPPQAPRFACKRLPPFPDRARFERYRRTLADYVAALRASGVRAVESELRGVGRRDGTIAGYVVQPALDAATLATAVLAAAEPDRGHPLPAAVVAAAAGAVGPRLGIDAQLSNWTWRDGELRYLDVTTPMLWSAAGEPELDVALIVRPLPWALRGPVRRFLAPRILDGYRRLRGVYFDLCGNLIKERLEAWLPAFLELVNAHLDEPMSAAQVRSYYRSDARLWSLLLALRRLDRTWQRRVRRRPYPFLLPGRIER